jgi:hypothetical protein
MLGSEKAVAEPPFVSRYGNSATIINISRAPTQDESSYRALAIVSTAHAVYYTCVHSEVPVDLMPGRTFEDRLTQRIRIELD